MTINAWGSDDPAEVAKGGTGAASLTDHGILLGSGTAAVTPTAAPTDGQLLIGSTGSDPALANITSTGATITVTNGAGTINLETAGSGGGGMVLLDTQTVSGVTEVVWDDTLITADYDHYLVYAYDLVQITFSVGLLFQVSTDGGSTWVTTSSYVCWGQSGSGSPSSEVDGFLRYNSNVTANGFFRANIDFPFSSSIPTTGSMVGVQSVGGLMRSNGYRDADESNDAIRMTNEGNGTFSGTFRLYGLTSS